MIMQSLDISSIQCNSINAILTYLLSVCKACLRSDNSCFKRLAMYALSV